MSVSELIRTNIKNYGPGELFNSAELLHFGKRASVDQTLVRLVFEKVLQNIRRYLTAQTALDHPPDLLLTEECF